MYNMYRRFYASQPCPSPSHFLLRCTRGGTMLALGAMSLPVMARICTCDAFCGYNIGLGSGAVPANTCTYQSTKSSKHCGHSYFIDDCLSTHFSVVQSFPFINITLHSDVITHFLLIVCHSNVMGAFLVSIISVLKIYRCLSLHFAEFCYSIWIINLLMSNFSWMVNSLQKCWNFFCFFCKCNPILTI